MALLTNKIRVLLQRVRNAGREPYKILMPKGLKFALDAEIAPRTVFDTERLGNDLKTPQEVDQAMLLSNCRTLFMGVPVVIDDNCTDVLIQAKPRPMSEDEPVPNIDWTKVLRTDRL